MFSIKEPCPRPPPPNDVKEVISRYNEDGFEEARAVIEKKRR